MARAPAPAGATVIFRIAAAEYFNRIHTFAPPANGQTKYEGLKGRQGTALDERV